MLLLEILKFLLRKPIVLFAFWQMFVMCVSRLGSVVIVTPRYFAYVTCSSRRSWRMYQYNVVVLDRCFLLGGGEYLAFIGVKFNLPFFFPCRKFIQVVLEGAIMRCYCEVCNGVICNVTVRYAIINGVICMLL